MLDIILLILLMWISYKLKEIYSLAQKPNIYNNIKENKYLFVLEEIWKMSKYIDCVVYFYIPIKIACVILGWIL